MRTFDARGAELAELVLIPNRVVIGRALARARSVDVSRGFGELEGLYPEALAHVECDGAQCELSGHTITVRAVPISTQKIAVRMRLVQRVVHFAKLGRSAGNVNEIEAYRAELLPENLQKSQLGQDAQRQVTSHYLEHLDALLLQGVACARAWRSAIRRSTPMSASRSSRSYPSQAHRALARSTLSSLQARAT